MGVDGRTGGVRRDRARHSAEMASCPRKPLCTYLRGRLLQDFHVCAGPELSCASLPGGALGRLAAVQGRPLCAWFAGQNYARFGNLRWARIIVSIPAKTGVVALCRNPASSNRFAGAGVSKDKTMPVFTPWLRGQ